MLRYGALLVVLATGRAFAQPPVELATKGCEGLDEAELLRLLAIELSAVQPADSAIQAPTVDVLCHGGWVRLTLFDRDSGGYLDRVIPAPGADDPGRERLVALAASQLVLAWLPRDTPVTAASPSEAGRPAPHRSMTTRPVQPTGQERSQPSLPAAQPVAAQQVDRAVDDEASFEGDLVLALRGGGRLGDLIDGTLPMATAGLAAGYGLSARWLSLVVVELATGSTARSAGVVDADTAQAGVGVAMIALQRRALRLEVDVVLSVRYVQLAGELGPDFEAVDAAGEFERDGVGFEGALSFGPMLGLGGAQVGVKLRGGVTAGGPLGRVSADRPVGRAGPFVGLSLELGARLRN
jgi:hypothetical protein